MRKGTHLWARVRKSRQLTPLVGESINLQSSVDYKLQQQWIKLGLLLTGTRNDSLALQWPHSQFTLPAFVCPQWKLYADDTRLRQACAFKNPQENVLTDEDEEQENCAFNDVRKASSAFKGRLEVDQSQPKVT